MVDKLGSESQFYALLIGIDYYEPNPYYGSLTGAVRDTSLVYGYLTKTLQIPQDQITKLISHDEETLNLKFIRTKHHEEILPTY